MIPIDLQGLITAGLEKDRRPPDQLLHASSDLVGSLRHTQLRYVGAPEVERKFVSDVRLMTGTLWHTYIHGLLQDAGMPFMEEVNLTPWMPEGWSGTADWLFYSPEYEAFVLGDLKTSKGESMEWKAKNGMSEDHYHQLSAYWYALVESGLPMLDKFFLMYLPITAPRGDSNVQPVICEAEPLDKDYLYGLMAERLQAADGYWNDIKSGQIYPMGEMTTEDFLNSDKLAPPMEREQKLFWKKDGQKWELKLVPHWLAAYCPFPNELCDCSEQGETKIGEYEWYIGDGLEDNPDAIGYTPRKGYEGIEPTEVPDEKEIRRRFKD